MMAFKHLFIIVDYYVSVLDATTFWQCMYLDLIMSEYSPVNESDSWLHISDRGGVSLS